MVNRHTSFETLSDNRINANEGVIYDVCVIREGEAKGHNVFIDRKSLETVQEVASEFKGGVKVKLRHGSEGQYQSVIDETCGILKNFRLDGQKVIADFYVLKSIGENTRSKIFEMAQTMPEQFGFSIVFSSVNKKIGGKNYLRCQELQSVDLSDKPAATDGLFSMKEPKFENGKDGAHARDCMCAECESKALESAKGADGGGTAKTVGDGTSPLDARMEAISKQVEALTKAIAGLTGLPTAFEDKTKDILMRLEKSEKFAAESAKALEANEKNTIITKLSNEGRVLFKEDGVAYNLEELQKLELPMLKFAAKNAQVIPTTARATYAGSGKPGKTIPVGADGKPLTGDALTTSAWEEKYGDIDQMIARSYHQQF